MRNNQLSSSTTLGANQSIATNFNNGQNVSVQSAVNFASHSANPFSNSVSSVASHVSKEKVMNLETNPKESFSTQSGSQSTSTRNGDSNLSAGMTGEINTTQQLLDSVTSQHTTNTSAQRQEAYKSLLNATRQIAESTTDSGIRSAAQNFEAQLTRAYQYGNRLSFEQNSTQSASKQLGYISNQDMKTLMDNSPSAMQKAIETFGSAEAAQNALFHSPTARSFFAQQLHDEMGAFRWNEGQPQPLSTVDIDTMARPHRHSFESETTKRFDENTSANHLDLQNARDSFTKGMDLSAPPSTATVKHSVDRERESINQNQQEMEKELLAERGSVLSAKLLYEDKQSGVNTVFRNAFLGGALYRSPQEYKDRIDEMSSLSEGMQQDLSESGAKGKINITDFERSAQK